MKLEPTDTGFAIDASDLVPLLDRTPEEVQRLMRDGAITSRFERGEARTPAAAARPSSTEIAASG